MPSRKLTTPVSVHDHIAALPQPLRTDVEALRKVILSSGKGIGEEIKWNAPSFHTGEHFATMRLNGKVFLQLILHLGARSKAAVSREEIADPDGLLQWLGPDRACINFEEPGAVAVRSRALKAILRQWIRLVPA